MHFKAYLLSFILIHLFIYFWFWQKWTGLLPERLAGVRVGLVAAGTRVHAVVAHQVVGAAGALTQSQSAAVHFEDVVIQQLVQDGCKRRTQSEQTPVQSEWFNPSGPGRHYKHAAGLMWWSRITHTGRARRSSGGWWDKRCRSDSRSGNTTAPETQTQTQRQTTSATLRRFCRTFQQVEFSSSSPHRMSLSADDWSLTTCRNCFKVFMIIYRLSQIRSKWIQWRDEDDREG